MKLSFNLEKKRFLALLQVLENCENYSKPSVKDPACIWLVKPGKPTHAGGNKILLGSGEKKILKHPVWRIRR